ncbi:MAG: Fe-S cluster assembly ATPase SufC [Deltaproteobacteria bacterium]|nr:Fe-S cluster assembly ATPase SufC [Deltaproteobacteria bacterium]
MLRIGDLFVSINGEPILNGINLFAEKGELIFIMGPNGSGKSTLAKTIMGSPEITVNKGFIEFEGEDILSLTVDERARRGIFMAFQYPQEVEGVNMRHFLKLAYEARFGEQIDAIKFKEVLEEIMKKLGVGADFVRRNLNVGFSGGEKKKSEILQLMLLKPKLAILDETDSGLDIDSLRSVADAIRRLRSDLESLTLMVITHYERLLNYLDVDRVYVMHKGRISKEGRRDLVSEIIKRGYNFILN